MSETSTNYARGVPYRKGDGQCSHPTCTAQIDWSRHDKAPTGWGHIVFSRRAKKGGLARRELLVCPAHTIEFAERQTSLLAGARKLVRTIIESPFAGDVATNLRYLRQALRDSLFRGEAPFASHALYTQEGVLDDNIPAERERGIEAGHAWSQAAQKVVVYSDLGISPGMKLGLDRHKQNGIVVEERQLKGWTGPIEISGALHK